MAAIRASKKRATLDRSAFSCNSAKANLEVRSIATNRYSLPASVLDLDDVDVEIADRIGLKLALVWLVTFHLGQAGDAVPL
jgi:hypothetical protein